MRRLENQCVGCDTCTLGHGCPMLNVQVVECDRCGDSAAFNIDGEDYCFDCALDMLKEEFNRYSISEMAEMLDKNCEEV